MEEKIESTVVYDERRKEMTQRFNSSQDIKIDDEIVGEVSLSRKAIFKESGIRKIIRDLNLQVTKFEKEIKQIKDNMKDEVEFTPELKELEKKIKIINDFNKNKQMKSQLETQRSELKTVKKDIQDIKNAIGTRLKL